MWRDVNGPFPVHTGAVTADSDPTLADDEERLAEYAGSLADAYASVALGWMVRLVERHSPDAASSAEPRLRTAAEASVGELRELLAADIADQPTGPLDVLRRSVVAPTEVLRDAGVPPVERDPFDERNFPEDVYDLSPASFADVDPSLHEPGLVWGAAKAHVHLRRRRELPAVERERATHHPTADQERVVALSVDLMDRSKISAAFPDAQLVRSVKALVDAAAGAALVLVDLHRVADPTELEALRTTDARVVAYGSHVDDERLQAASAAGAEAVPRSVFFRRLENDGV